MVDLRRQKYLNMVDDQSITILYSGSAPHMSADAYYPFVVNKDFWYMTGIDQERVVLLLVKSHVGKASYLFMEKIDPVQALWVGAGLTFEEASKISQIPLENIMELSSFDGFLGGLLSSTRRATYGSIQTLYFDIERLTASDLPLLGERKALYYAQMYPHLTIKNAQPFIHELRGVKDQEEIDAIKGAMKVHYEANLHLLDNIKTAKNESDLDAIFNFVLNRYQTKPSFESIIASGKNATILHYVKNNQPIGKNDLVLFDLGVRYNYYASDITRTYPASGKFSERQKAIYQAVLNVNKKVISWVKAGVTQAEYNAYGKKLLAEEAMKIGLIKDESEITKYYYHSLGHALGLDVHDVGDFAKPFKVGQVITVEPGLYVAEEGIGVRIEDNVVLTETGCINLSEDLIKEVDDIEVYLAKV
jgi:Xaa-Pro aminopeptidase